MTNNSQQRASEKRHYQVSKKNLPLSCPTKEMRLWDSHPKVFLPIEKTGEATCEYCGAKYTLVDFEKPES